MSEYVSLIGRIESAIRDNWELPALTHYGSEHTVTYGRLAKSIAYIHILFEEYGVRPGEKVAICDSNYRNWCIAFIATVTYGAVAVPLLPNYSDSQIVMLCAHSASRVFFGNSSHASLWPRGKCPMLMIKLSDMLAMFLDENTDEMDRRVFGTYARRYPHGYSRSDVSYFRERPDDMMLLSYTSGSTGNPKGVMLSYRSIEMSVRYMARPPMRVNGNILAILPLAHMFGLTYGLLSGIVLGCRITLLTSKPKTDVLIRAIMDVRPEVFCTVPLIFDRIVMSDRCGEILALLRDSGIREFVMGGAPLNPMVEDVLLKNGIPISVGYGMTETGPLISHSHPGEYRRGSCGRQIDGVEVRILSPRPQDVPGEIAVRGGNLMLGYYLNPQATADTLDSDGWLHTGDMGVMDSDGYIFVRGRIKNMLLTSNGQNVYPEEAEEQVVSYTPFEECVVVSREQGLVALVYISDQRLAELGMTRETVEGRMAEYLAQANSHLPSHCRLKAMEQRDSEFEKTPKNSIRRFLYS